MKLALGFSFLVVYMRLQLFLAPYRSTFHNQLEVREIICSISTLYTAVYFNQED